MTKLEKTTFYLEKLFWVFLFINPFLDIINGLYINLVMGVDILDIKFVSTLGVTPSLIVRMIMLVIFACYVLLVRDKKSILTALPIGAAWILSMVSEYLNFGSAQYFLDTQYTARFCFNVVLLMVYTRVLSNRWGEDGKELLRRLDRVVCVTITVLSLSILISAVIGVGYSTYADRMGYRGSRGFFYAGNDITAILAVLLPLCVANTMRVDIKAEPKKMVFPAISTALGANAMLIIGSKTAFIAFAATCVLMLIAALVFMKRENNKNIFFGYLSGMICTAVIFAALMLLSSSALLQTISDSLKVTSDLAENEGMATAMLSGRQIKLKEHLEMFMDGGPIVWLFGLGRGCQEEILEMDVFEILFYYGIFGFCAMFWIYVKVAINFFTSFFKKLDPTACALFTALGLCAGYLFIAGHVLFSVTSGFYFAFTIIYSRVYFAENSKDVLLWKQK